MATKYVTVGGAGTNSGDDEANAYTMAQATAAAALGDKFWVKAGTYSTQDGTSSSIMDIQTEGDANQWIEWEAYTTTIGDFTVGDAQPVILDATSTYTNALKLTSPATISIFNKFIGFGFTNATGDGVGGSTTENNLAFHGCKFYSNGDMGVRGNDNIVFWGCEFTGNTTAALNADNNVAMLYCKIHGETGSTYTVEAQGDMQMVGCVLYNNVNATAFVRVPGTVTIIGNTFDGDGGASAVAIAQDGAAGNPVALFNNIFYDFSTALLYGTTADEAYARGYNLFFSNTTDYDGLSLHATDITGTEDPFTNSASRDYTLKSASEALHAGVDGSIL